MKTVIAVYNEIRKVVSFFSKLLRFDEYKKSTGRKLAMPMEETISLALFWKGNNIATKKSIHRIFNLKCSYKTLVVNLNRWYHLAMLVLILVMKRNEKNQHLVKHIDSTDIPVCLFKNANAHKTMKGLASFGRSSKGTYFGLKMHLIADFRRKMLRVKFTSANVDDRDLVIPMSKDLLGILVGDAGYIKKKLQREFHEEEKRIFLAKPRKNMKILMTKFQQILYDSRALIELNFRNLKMFHGLITSLPRSVDGYLANYIYSLLAYQIA